MYTTGISGSLGATFLATPYHIPRMTYLPSLMTSVYPTLLQTLQLAITGVVLAGCSRLLFSLVSSFRTATKTSMTLNRDTTAYFWVKDWLQDELVSDPTVPKRSARQYIYPPSRWDAGLPTDGNPPLTPPPRILMYVECCLQWVHGYKERVWPSGQGGLRYREILVKAAPYPWLLAHKLSSVDPSQGKTLSGCKQESRVASKGTEPTWEIFSQSAKSHYLRYRGYLIKVTPSRTVGAYSDTIDWLTFSAHFAPQSIWSDLLQAAYTHSRLRLSDHIETYRHSNPSYSNPGPWQPGPSRPHRPWSSVILPQTVKDGVLEDCKSFLMSASFYQDRGLPYRRGYLLYGKPGTGKTSLISALASELLLPIYLIDLSCKDMDDTTLQILINDCPARCIILIEDIDCAFPMKRDPEAVNAHVNPRADNDRPKSSVTLSGLLNALDGVATAEGRLLFCTTNHIEKIDPALSRPGRCDVWIEFRLATAVQIRDVFRHFYDPSTTMDSVAEAGNVDPDIEKTGLPVPSSDKNIIQLSNDFARQIPPDSVSVSAVQAYMMRWKDRPVDAVSHAEEWVKGGYSQDPTMSFTASDR